jgi:hypothetical protein
MAQSKLLGSVTCSHCGDHNAERLPSLGDYSAYRCPVCGVYRISSTHETLFDNGSRDPKKAHFRLDPDGYRWLGGG